MYDSTTLAGMVGQQLRSLLNATLTVVSSDGPVGLALQDEFGRRVDISATVDKVWTLALTLKPRAQKVARASWRVGLGTRRSGVRPSAAAVGIILSLSRKGVRWG